MRIAQRCTQNNDAERETGGYAPDNIVRWRKKVCVCEHSTTNTVEMAKRMGVLLWDGKRLSHMMKISGRRTKHKE